MGRGTAIILGLLGLILPGYLFYVTYEIFGLTITALLTQGFFYKLNYLRAPDGSSETNWERITSDWIKPEMWGDPGNIEMYLYLASFALAVLGFIILLSGGTKNGGAFIFLVAGLVNLGLMLLVYNNLEVVFQLPTVSGYPIPVGSIFLILAGLMGRRD